MNRKLIRPNLSEYKENISRDAAKKKPHPPFETHAENYYFLKQMNKKTMVSVAFLDGEIVTGYVEWYDRNCIKLTREGAPNLMIYKSSIKYLHKIEEGSDVSHAKKTASSKNPSPKKTK